jgi:hypothetical protein
MFNRVEDTRRSFSKDGKNKIFKLQLEFKLVLIKKFNKKQNDIVFFLTNYTIRTSTIN